MKNTLRKIVIIGLSLLMLLSLLGQFLVSAEELEQEDENEILEINTLNTEVNEDETIIENEEEKPTTDIGKTHANLHKPDVTCDEFELVTIAKDGIFTVQACYSDFTSAISAMNNHKDSSAALRHKNSNSPMKFIAAKRAILNPVPHRVNGSATMSIANTNAKTYISRSYEMAYFSTDSYNTSSGLGNVSLGTTGFLGTAQLKQLDIIPMVYVENKIMIELGGSTAKNVSPSIKNTRLNAAPAQSFYTISQSTSGKVISFTAEHLHRRENEPYRVDYLANMTLGPADQSWMKEGRYYSWDGINFYSDRDYKTFAGTYYNYYQFLPLRSKTKLSANDLDSFLANRIKTTSAMSGLGASYLEYGLEYGFNPLLVFALSSHESAWGTSNIAKTKFNFFGWNATDSNPGAASQFETPDLAVKDYMGIKLRGYLDVTFADGYYKKDFRYQGGHLGNRGSGLNLKYASDPYWGMKIAAIAYQIDLAAGLKDYKAYTLGLVSDGNEYVAKSLNVTNTNENTGANRYENYYNFKSSTGYMPTITTTIIDTYEKHYKTQTFAAIDNNSNIIDIDSKTAAFPYNWEKSVGFIKKGKVEIVSERVATEILRLGGKNRQGTAVLASQSVYNTANAVVLSGSGGDVDALTGTLLAAEKDAPLLITHKDHLTDTTKAEIIRLQASTVYILGGTNAISQAVEDEINLMGLQVERFQGTSRYDTAVKVAKYVKPSGSDHAFLVVGITAKKNDALADALAIGPVSAKLKSPVLLASLKGLPQETSEAIANLNVRNITIVGGTAAISSEIEQELKDLGINIERVFGKSREETAIKIADRYFDNTNLAIIANGRRSADALVGGYLGGYKDAPILLAHNTGLSQATKDYLQKRFYNSIVLGGEAVVSAKTLAEVKKLVNIN